MSSSPKYEKAKQHIMQMLKEQQMQPGDKLPSEAELSSELSVSAITIKKALSDLVFDGVIYRVKGRGSFVSDHKKLVTKSRIIAMVFALESIEDPAFSGWIFGAQSYLRAHNYSLIVERIEAEPGVAQEQINRLLGLGVDGFLLYLHTPDEMLAIIDQVERVKPLVLLDRRSLLRTCSYVGANNFDGAMLAVQYLLGLGHRRIGFVDFNAFLNSEQERYQGYRHAMASYGIDPDAQQHANLLSQTAEEIIESLRSHQSTALFAVNDAGALSLIELLQRAGLRVPQDVSVVGFDHIALGPENPLRLTSVRQSFDQQGYKGAWLLDSIIHGHCTRGTQIQVGLSLEEGNSAVNITR